MKILNFGSLNLDYVYTVDHMAAAGETLASEGLQVFCGGKGLNQSIALAKAGIGVYHAGLIGKDGENLLQACRDAGVHTAYIEEAGEKTGHAIIQVDHSGQNCILLYGGANRNITKEFVDRVLADFAEGDLLLLQNEISQLDFIIDRAYEKGMEIILNPSPYDENIGRCDLSKVSLFLLNEIEGNQMTGETEPDRILDRLQEMYPGAEAVLTLGSGGSVYQDGKQRIRQGIFPVQVADTTAAGDTFTGYFLASRMEGRSAEECLRRASRAAAIAVSRAGAAQSIPEREEVDAFTISEEASEYCFTRPNQSRE